MNYVGCTFESHDKNHGAIMPIIFFKGLFNTMSWIDVAKTKSGVFDTAI